MVVFITQDNGAEIVKAKNKTTWNSAWSSGWFFKRLYLNKLLQQVGLNCQRFFALFFLMFFVCLLVLGFCLGVFVCFFICLYIYPFHFLSHSLKSYTHFEDLFLLKAKSKVVKISGIFHVCVWFTLVLTFHRDVKSLVSTNFLQERGV